MLTHSQNFSNDIELLKNLNKELSCYKIKLKFWYYDVSPFQNGDFIKIEKLVLKYVELFGSYYNKIFILSSLGKKEFSNCVPYLIKIYKYFINNIYKSPKDEMFLLHLCDTIAKIDSKAHISLYRELLQMPMTSSMGSIIEMLDRDNVEELEEDVFKLIQKENVIPDDWEGKMNEEDKYWCSLMALKYIVNRKKDKYLEFFNNLINYNSIPWIHFSDSKYKDKLLMSCEKKYKKLAEKGIKMLKQK